MAEYGYQAANLPVALHLHYSRGGGGDVETTAGGVTGLGSEGSSLQDAKQDPNWRLVL